MERGRGSIGGKEGENMHCTENPIYVFPETKLRNLIPNSYINVPVNDLYIPKYMNVVIRRRDIIILFWK